MAAVCSSWPSSSLKFARALELRFEVLLHLFQPKTDLVTARGSRDRSGRTGLTHIARTVTDLNRSVAFYERLLSVRVLYRDERKVEIGTPGSKDVSALEQAIGPEVGASGGIGHFGFRLARPQSFDEVAAEVERCGRHVLARGEFAPGEPCVFARDPDGYLMELWYEPGSNARD